MTADTNGAGDAGNGVPLEVEMTCCSWILARVREGRPFPLIEADALVRTLFAGLRSGSLETLRLCTPESEIDYASTHALNTSILSMILAEERGMDSREVRSIGLAGLLHDVGMARVPRDLLQRPSVLDAEELRTIEGHPGTGAAVLLQAGAVELVLPAIVSYEHHQHVDGGGYPDHTLAEGPHPASRLVQLASVYDALRSERPFRAARSHGECLDDLRSGMGSQFDEALTRTLLRVLEEWTPRYGPPVARPSGSDGRSGGGPATPS